MPEHSRRGNVAGKIDPSDRQQLLAGRCARSKLDTETWCVVPRHISDGQSFKDGRQLERDNAFEKNVNAGGGIIGFVASERHLGVAYPVSPDLKSAPEADQ